MCTPRSLAGAQCVQGYSLSKTFECSKCRSKTIQLVAIAGASLGAFCLAGALSTKAMRDAADGSNYRKKVVTIGIAMTALTMMQTVSFVTSFNYKCVASPEFAIASP